MGISTGGYFKIIISVFNTLNLHVIRVKAILASRHIFRFCLILSLFSVLTLILVAHFCINVEIRLHVPFQFVIISLGIDCCKGITIIFSVFGTLFYPEGRYGYFAFSSSTLIKVCIFWLYIVSDIEVGLHTGILFLILIFNLDVWIVIQRI